MSMSKYTPFQKRQEVLVSMRDGKERDAAALCARLGIGSHEIGQALARLKALGLVKSRMMSGRNVWRINPTAQEPAQ